MSDDAAAAAAGAGIGAAGAGIGAAGAGIGEGLADVKIEKIKPKKKRKGKKKKAVKKMGGGMLKYSHGGLAKGGKPRGCGVARQGVRPVKMIKMKGA